MTEDRKNVMHGLLVSDRKIIDETDRLLLLGCRRAFKYLHNVVQTQYVNKLNGTPPVMSAYLLTLKGMVERKDQALMRDG